MFLGTHYPRLDEKSRLILPARFRDDLAGGLVLTKGQERCLVIWPRGEFERYAEKLRAASPTSEAYRRYSRVFFASAHDDTLDRQGRITIPAPLRAYAGLSRDCAVTGSDTRIEVWDATAWEQYLSDSEDSFADLDGEVVPG